MENKLGKRVEYSDQYDPNQLDFFPRSVRRKGYTSQMYGGDIWTCYEVSYLLLNGCPQNLVLRILNPADSQNIFESKSLKLYLNSFNNTKFRDQDEVLQIITGDLSDGVDKVVEVSIIDKFKRPTAIPNIDYLANVTECGIYHYDSTLLERSREKSSTGLQSNLLRSNCEITNQPDWANIQVIYSSNFKLNEVSFLRYIVSFRNHQEFHEPTCERIYNDLYKMLEPIELTVICQYTRRGGIDINPVRTNLKDFKINKLILDLPKLLQQ